MNVLRSASGREARAATDIGALTRAVRRGDEAAFDRFYETYCDRLYRLLLSLTRGDEQSSRDVLQSVMIKLARKLPVIETESELWSWLACVARNALVDHIRRARRQDGFAALDLASDCEIARDENPDDSGLKWLEAAVDALPGEDFWLVREYYFERRSHRELAVVTGKTPKAIESRLARIRHRLLAVLNERRQHE
jgi:RNA polymerase sigma-70 factor (ECF subfamily)